MGAAPFWEVTSFREVAKRREQQQSRNNPGGSSKATANANAKLNRTSHIGVTDYGSQDCQVFVSYPTDAQTRSDEAGQSAVRRRDCGLLEFERDPVLGHRHASVVRSKGCDVYCDGIGRIVSGQQ